MADNEERIAVVPFKGDFLRTQADWKHEGKYPACRLRNVYGISRAEAVERMAKTNWIAVVCFKNKCTPDSISQKEWNAEWIKLPNPYKKVYFAGAEAALDDLLGEKK